MIDQFIQESGRVSRDGSHSSSVMLVLPNNTSGPGFEEEMRQYIKSTDVCRRSILMNAIENSFFSQLEIPHSCCDICALTCSCVCVCEDKTLCSCTTKCIGSDTFLTLAEISIMQIASQLDRNISQLPVVFNITQDDRDILEVQLLEMRVNIIDEGARANLLIHPDVATGFTTDLVSSIVKGVEHIASLQVLLDYFPFFNVEHALKVYECIQHLFASKLITDSDDSDDCIVDLPPSDTSSDDCFNSDEDDWDKYTKPVLRDTSSDSD